MTKIMLVEDDNNLREIYEARLSAEGYEIVSAENGEAALAMAAKERPDMIISDVMMPKISGFEMLDILRNTNSLKNVKIIMLTALGQAEDSQRAATLGADRYLVKSQVTLEDIVKATHDLLDDPNKLANLPTGEATADAPVVAAATEAVGPAAAADPEPAAEAPAAPPADPAPSATDTSAADPVAVPDAPVASAPVDQLAQDAGVTPAPEPISVPAEPLAVVEPPADSSEPAVESPSEPSPAPSVISIPVSDGGDDAQPDASAPMSDVADTTSDATVEPISVVEPPAAPEVVPAPAPEPTAEAPAELVAEPTAEPTETAEAPAEQPAVEEQPAADYTSPDSFNNFQAAPVTNAAAAPTETVTPAETLEAPSGNSDQAAEAPDQAAPPVEIPTLMTASDMPPSSDVDSDPITVDGPADPVPQPEELDGFSAPVISAPEGEAVPTPTVQSIAVTDGNEAAEAPAQSSDANDDQLREAAQDLAEGASEAANTAASANADNRLKVISPLPADESKPTIHQLLAVEEAKNGAQQAVQATEQATPNVDAYAPSANPQAAAPADEPDPNSISL